MLEVQLVTKQAFHTIGLRWKGTFQGAAKGEIRELIAAFKNRLDEIPDVINKNELYGFTDELTDKGFTYYVMAETKKSVTTPDGMVSLSIPTRTYAMCTHQKGMNVDQTYEDLEAWYTSNGYALVPGALSFETYPIDYHPLKDEPEFSVYHPVHEKS